MIIKPQSGKPHWENDKKTIFIFEQYTVPGILYLVYLSVDIGIYYTVHIANGTLVVLTGSNGAGAVADVWCVW